MPWLIPSIRPNAEPPRLWAGLAVAGGAVAWGDDFAFSLSLFISTATEIGSGSNCTAPAFSLW